MDNTGTVTLQQVLDLAWKLTAEDRRILAGRLNENDDPAGAKDDEGKSAVPHADQDENDRWIQAVAECREIFDRMKAEGRFVDSDEIVRWIREDRDR